MLASVVGTKAQWRHRREPYGQCAIAQQLCFPPSDHEMWTNSLNNLPRLSDGTLGGLCMLATTSSKHCSKSYAFTVEAYTLQVVASGCIGLRKFRQTVAVSCLNCLSTFYGLKAKNTAAAPSHTACTVVSNASTVLQH
ncbi:hypothetical protein ANAPRD1_01206 [Anaplasma phagocytophilum]|nr:hypothetical protein ANAPRD1_01206 [Anaplasma phagocytophilum]